MGSETSLLSSLVDAGSAGLIILVVFLFIKFLKDINKQYTLQVTSLMKFIEEQREAHLKAETSSATVTAEALGKADKEHSDAYAKVVEAIKELTAEINIMNKNHSLHQQETSQAILDMKERVKSKP